MDLYRVWFFRFMQLLTTGIFMFGFWGKTPVWILVLLFTVGVLRQTSLTRLPWGRAVILVTDFLFAAAGIFLGIGLIWLVLGTTMALITWELSAPVDGESMLTMPFHQKRSQSLMVMAVVSLLIFTAGVMLRFQLPFVIVFFLTIGIFAAFYRLVRSS